ncbi:MULTISPECIES: sulfotransferase [unclassified Ruegeria]|uniref:sulfotransferase family protein n=2 Tax=Ruegeria TaxID=97050 RepID=UPI00148944CD
MRDQSASKSMNVKGDGVDASANSVVIFGVGRSGTTALFHYLHKAYQSMQQDHQIRYEPFLWGVKQDDLDTAFTTTDELSVPGMYAHTQTPLFLKGAEHEALDRFISDLTLDDTPFLVKFIKANGRIDHFLKRWPNAKFVFIFREPCSVVNSVLPMFSFFGDEYHPSDTRRFPSQALLDPSVFHAASYAVKQLMYWRVMNEAAIESLDRYPDRILPVSQEALLLDPKATLSKVMDFCFPGAENNSAIVDELAAGREGQKPRFAFKNLGVTDFDEFRSQMDWYEKTLLPRCQSGVDVNYSKMRDTINAAWTKGRFADSLPEGIPRNTISMALRHDYLDNFGTTRRIFNSEGAVVFRGSLFSRFPLSWKTIVGGAMPLGRTTYLRLHNATSVEDGLLPETCELKKRNSVFKLKVYLLCALGKTLPADKYFSGIPSTSNDHGIVLSRKGNVFRRVFSSLRILRKREIPLRKFDVFVVDK